MDRQVSRPIDDISLNSFPSHRHLPVFLNLRSGNETFLVAASLTATTTMEQANDTVSLSLKRGEEKWRD